ALANAIERNPFWADSSGAWDLPPEETRRQRKVRVRPPDGLRAPADAARKPRKPRRPSISKMIEEAERAGKPGTSITMPEGTTINFSQEPSGEVDTPASVVAPDRIIELCKRGKRGS